LRLAFSLALATTMGLVLASIAVASPGDQLTGGGISSAGTHIGFTAHDGPNGPSGHATLKNKTVAPPSAERKGHVVCIQVSGNQAVFGIQDVNEVTGDTLYREFAVEDNGNPKKGQPVDDLVEVGTDTTAPPSDCRANPQPVADNFRLLHGNIEVRDR
jgi:hypothetical protein